VIGRAGDSPPTEGDVDDDKTLVSDCAGGGRLPPGHPRRDGGFKQPGEEETTQIELLRIASFGASEVFDQTASE
jgi:hypothetical protein